MKYSLEQQMDIGRRMYLHEITCKEAMAHYDISESYTHKYMTAYKKANGIPLKQSGCRKDSSLLLQPSSASPDIETYMAISKEELVNELILAKANELRAKKGYEVKGVGANREYISLNSRNTKS